MINKLLLALILLFPLSAYAADSAGRGYTQTSCGFDWDQDGTRGEASGDCNIVCRDSTGTGPQTSDLDSDGDNEEEYYVDCDAGSNSDTGGPEDPFLTLAYALAQVDGVADSAEDIVCFKGTCDNETEITPPIGDSAESYWVKTKSGNEYRDWQYPQDPGGIFGWDADGDGEYPPYDTDDTAILDGSGTTSDESIFKFVEGTTYFELAHFKVQNYFDDNLNYSGDTKLFDGYRVRHASIHDIEIDGFSKNGCFGGNTRVFNMGMAMDYVEFRNLDIQNAAGKILRGGAGSYNGAVQYGTESGPLRIQSVSLKRMGPADATDSSTCYEGRDHGAPFGRSWGTGNGTEIIDSVFDNNLDNWYAVTGASQTGVTISQCLQDFRIINNAFYGFTYIASVNGGDSFFCSNSAEREIQDVVVDSNYLFNDFEILSGIVNIDNEDCYDGNMSDGTVQATNNMAVTDGDGQVKYGFLMDLSSTTDISTSTGKTLIANNTIFVETKNWDNGPIIGIKSNCATDFTHDVEIYNNLIVGLSTGDRAFQSDWSSQASLSLDYNIYSGSNEWVVNGTTYRTLSALETAHSFEANGDTCTPTFIGGIDYHLDTSDTCAQENGVTLSSDFTVDYDNDARPQGTYWDIGADEFASGYAAEGACCDSDCAITTDAACTDWNGSGTTCSPDPCEEEPIGVFMTIGGVTIGGVEGDG